MRALWLEGLVLSLRDDLPVPSPPPGEALVRNLHAVPDGLPDVDPRPLAEARYPLADAVAAFEHAARPGTLKVLIDC